MRSYDPQCYELAQHFAPDGYSEAQLDELAQVIQDAIEAHLDVEEDASMPKIAAKD